MATSGTAVFNLDLSEVVEEAFERNLAVFLATDLGWATNCLPEALPARFARVVAAYSWGERLLIAASGRYLSPVSEDRLPLLVLHF